METNRPSLKAGINLILRAASVAISVNLSGSVDMACQHCDHKKERQRTRYHTNELFRHGLAPFQKVSLISFTINHRLRSSDRPYFAGEAFYHVQFYLNRKQSPVQRRLCGRVHCLRFHLRERADAGSGGATAGPGYLRVAEHGRGPAAVGESGPGLSE